MKYAQSTSVSSDKTRAEIDHCLTRYGATGFMYGWQGDAALIAFAMRGRSVKFLLPLPAKSDHQFTHHSFGPHKPEAALAQWEQACRQRWRALALCIKAKLEAVECGITTFKHEFLAHFATPDGRTVGEVIIPQLNDATNPPLILLG
jgi:hypothetical protein